MTQEISFQISEAKYLLDECVPPGIPELSSPEYVEFTKILTPGTSDDIVFEEAKKRDLVVVTVDAGFVLWAITRNQNIVYQNKKGKRYLIEGKSKIVATNCFYKPVKKRTKYLLRNDEIIIP